MLSISLEGVEQDKVTFQVVANTVISEYEQTSNPALLNKMTNIKCKKNDPNFKQQQQPEQSSLSNVPNGQQGEKKKKFHGNSAAIVVPTPLPPLYPVRNLHQEKGGQSACETPTCNQKSANRIIGNPNISVQAKENQNTTHNTPFIAFLACGLVNENLQVVSSRLPEPDKNLLHRDKVKRCRRVKELLDRARKPRKEVDWNREGKFMQGYLKKVWVEGEMYSIGDVILVLNRNHLFWEEPGKYREIPLDAMIQDFFWFGWITFLDRNAHTAHLQWFEHGSRILLSKRADDRQLFYMPYCESSVVFKTKCTLEW
ncbi:hypothetical protein NMY22_g12262 [Coprinellus aureogranulatus]|nr:hypothetical protein NMY22_g12262 [Coprinellus aureogranulatus]